MTIELRNVNFSNSSFELKNVSLSIKEGRINGIGGPNGSGKTTLLKLMYNFLKPNKGEILIDGKDIQRYSRKELSRKISVVHQETYDPFNFTVQDVVSLAGYSKGEDGVGVDSALDLCNISSLKHRQFGELSGGERRLVMFAASIYQDSDIMLLDEPTAFLDVDKEILVIQIIKKMVEKGKTIILVMHDINSLYRISDHVILLKNGVVESEGPPETAMTESALERVYGIDFYSYDTIDGKRFSAIRRENDLERLVR